MDTSSCPPDPDLSERLLQGLVVVLALLSLFAAQMLPQEAPVGKDTAVRVELKILARYTLGMDSVVAKLDPNNAQRQALIASLEQGVTNPRDRLCLVPVVAAMGNPELARDWLEELRNDPAGDDALSWSLDLDAFEATLGPSGDLADGELADGAPSDLLALTPELDQRLDAFGWFGELARSRVAGSMPQRIAEAQRLAVGIIGAVLFALLAFGIGCALAVVAWISWRSGRLKSGYVQLTAGGGELSRRPYLEALILFILSLQLLGVVSGTWMAQNGSRWPLLIHWLALAVLAWPVWRGLPRSEVRAALGWSVGGGFREVAAGVVGYLAAAPLLATGFLLTVLVSQMIEQQPYHPILEWVSEASTFDALIIASAAVIWAPILEESVFRGAFFHYLRGRWGALLSATFVGITFAALHPQGVAGLPFLISLAIALALIREWRGSLIAPITVHMIHNGLIMCMLLLVWS